MTREVGTRGGSGFNIVVGYLMAGRMVAEGKLCRIHSPHTLGVPPVRVSPATLPASALALCGLGLLAAATPRTASAQSPFDAMHVRSIGPAVMGGRLHDVEVDPRDPSTIYVGAAAGVASGSRPTRAPRGRPSSTRRPITRSATSRSSRAIRKSCGPARASRTNRQSSSWGGGIYRSADAGATWTFLGLKNSGSIGRVLLHPTDANIAWVAVVGDLWKPSSERGLFKTTDAPARAGPISSKVIRSRAQTMS